MAKAEGEIVRLARFHAARSQFGRIIARPGLTMVRGGRRRR
jgi:hypothetical protein